MHNTIDSLHDYVFGSGLTAGIAAISGDAGGEVDRGMTFDEFVEVIEAYLRNEDDESAYFDVSALRKQFESKRLLRELYDEFKTWQDESAD